jgi:hypothetical protein
MLFAHFFLNELLNEYLLNSQLVVQKLRPPVTCEAQDSVHLNKVVSVVCSNRGNRLHYFKCFECKLLFHR